jgi:hypothetical protein
VPAEAGGTLAVLEVPWQVDEEVAG